VIAQSAGDEQYSDPFAGQGQGEGNEQSQQPAPAPAPAPTPTPAPAPTTTTPAGSTPVEPIATVAGTLPRTGAETGWVAAGALLLLAAGVGLRQVAGRFAE
jgi:LPXTG-motif cell wall-anchored protein